MPSSKTVTMTPALWTCFSKNRSQAIGTVRASIRFVLLSCKALIPFQNRRSFTSLGTCSCSCPSSFSQVPLYPLWSPLFRPTVTLFLFKMKLSFWLASSVLALSSWFVEGVTSRVDIIGKSGVSAMQLVLIDDHRLILLDKAENNAMQVNGHASWGQIYDYKLGQNIPLDMLTNTFCAAGSFLSNGSLVSTGGNPAIVKYDSQNGYQAIRIFDTTCETNCNFYENPTRSHLTSNRWYPTTVRLPDGGVLIAGGDEVGEFTTGTKTNNPTYEFFPPRGDGKQIGMKFLNDTLPFNLFPYIAVMRDGRLLVQANNQLMLYNYTSRTETRLKTIPGGAIRSYPQSGASALLPLVSSNNYHPTFVFCGGSNITNTRSFTVSDPADNTCASIQPLDGATWKTFKAPSRRVMGEFQHLPDGTLLLLNGAINGLAGFGNSKTDIGQSNAKDPNLQPEQFFPDTMTFSTAGWAKTSVPRMYHSTSSILPNSTIIIMGSNPNGDVQTRPYQTEYRIELITPPYLLTGKPQSSVVNTLPAYVQYGHTFNITLDMLPAGTTASQIRVTLMDAGFATHGVKMDHRAVVLDFTLSGTTITPTIPSHTNIYPPGPGWIFVMINGVPIKEAQQIIVGSKGQQPPSSKTALRNAQAIKPYPQPENQWSWTNSGCESVNQSTCVGGTYQKQPSKHGAKMGETVSVAKEAADARASQKAHAEAHAHSHSHAHGHKRRLVW